MANSTQVFGSTFSMLGALDLAGGESMAGDHGGISAQHGLDLARRELAPIERTEIGELAWVAPVYAMTEIVLAAGVEREVGGQDAAVFVEEPDQTAEMIDSAHG